MGDPAGNTMEQFVKIAGNFKKGIGVIKDADENLQAGDKIYSETYDEALRQYGDPEIATRAAERARKEAIGGRGFIDGINYLTAGRLPLGPEATVAVDQYIAKLKRQYDADAMRSNIQRAPITNEQVHKDMTTK